MGLQINQYPIERTELGADDFLDIDYWDGTQYRTAKIKGGAIGKNYLSFQFENDLGFTIPKGTIVYLRSSSSSANYPHADLANATTELTSSKTIGAVYDDVANGAVGLIVQVGEVDNLDTSAFNVGDKLWLSNVDGQVTTSEPQTPLHAVFIGIVTRSQNGNGRIVYNIQNGYELEELHNVTSDNYTTPQDEDSFLFLDETQEIWKRLTLDTLKSNLGGGTNPTSGFLPYNNGGVFADSVIQQNDYFGLFEIRTTNTMKVDIQSGGGQSSIFTDLVIENYGIGNKEAFNNFSSSGLWVDGGQGLFGLNTGDNPNFPEFIRDKPMQLFQMRDAMSGSNIAIAGGNVNLYAGSSSVVINASNLIVENPYMFLDYPTNGLVQANKWLKIIADDWGEYMIPLYTY